MVYIFFNVVVIEVCLWVVKNYFCKVDWLWVILMMLFFDFEFVLMDCLRVIFVYIFVNGWLLEWFIVWLF